MDIEAGNTVYRIPNFGTHFVAKKDESLEIYRELNKIAEEIEECRSRSI